MASSGIYIKGEPGPNNNILKIVNNTGSDKLKIVMSAPNKLVKKYILSML